MWFCISVFSVVSYEIWERKERGIIDWFKSQGACWEFWDSYGCGHSSEWLASMRQVLGCVERKNTTAPSVPEPLIWFASVHWEYMQSLWGSTTDCLGPVCSMTTFTWIQIDLDAITSNFKHALATSEHVYNKYRSTSRSLISPGSFCTFFANYILLLSLKISE